MKGNKRNTREVHGWLPINKPHNITSASVVSGLKHIFRAKKVGHAGTLDKPATGVLAIAFGEATKTIPYVMDSKKSYTFSVQFGQSTTTDDATGDVLESSPDRPTDNEIDAALDSFRGHIMQIPPKYSAVKIDGKRAAALAASGKDTPLAARPLEVNQLKMVNRKSENVAEFRMVCGKGGYVRSIARDLGLKLGCYGHVNSINRTATGPFSIEQCAEYPMENSTTEDTYFKRFLVTIEVGLIGINELKCELSEAKRIRSGNPVRMKNYPNKSEECFWTSYNGRALAIGKFIDGTFHPKRVFNFDLNIGNE